MTAIEEKTMWGETNPLQTQATALYKQIQSIKPKMAEAFYLGNNDLGEGLHNELDALRVKFTEIEQAIEAIELKYCPE